MATKAETTAAALEAGFADNPSVLSVGAARVDGQSVDYKSWDEQKGAYLFFKRGAARERGRRPLVASFNLNSAWG